MINPVMTAIASTLLLWSPKLFAVSTLAYPETTQSSTDRELVGTIDHTLSVRIKLTQAGTVLRGSYAYEKIGKSLRLKGAMDGEVEFHLDESDDAGNQTGKFNGKFVTPDWIEGSWSSTRVKKEIPFSAFVVDGKLVPAASPDDKISGQYKRVIQGRFDKNSATLNVWLLKDGSVRIQGDAIWIGNVKTGNVNIGEVDDIFASQGNKFSNNRTGGDSCSFRVRFAAGSVTATDDTMNCGGINVTFDGKYRKIGPPKP